ncbi:aminoglycoside phosphotransferase family protein [Lentzea californiensis]|uniref:aminoglycoside phosphotransferase family protein n=1 Tax=Lentzea californiensis TaxID=438851 RepID=UPI0021641D06|nr:aminoglycoside phosphotransferase family protein [Lentzea californiensis]MCR3748128.1 hypothetical protein [Lentzea californiensis]
MVVTRPDGHEVVRLQVPDMIKAAPDLLEIASALLPGTRLDDALVAPDGDIHRVLLIPGAAAVRVSKRPLAAASMPRRVEVLRHMASAGLPFQVPEPLTPVTTFGDQAAVAVSWIGGTALPQGAGDPAQVAEVLEAVRSVPLDDALLEVLDDRARGPSWSEIIAGEIRSPPARSLAGRGPGTPGGLPGPGAGAGCAGARRSQRFERALVGGRGAARRPRLDMAMPADPAIDAALMAWHGWESVRRAVSASTYRRARTWDALFGVEHLVATMNGRPMTSPDGFVSAIVPWLEANVPMSR